MSLNALKLFAKNAWEKKYLQALQNLSIKRKLTLIIMLTGGIAILLACATFVIYDLMSFRNSMVRSLSIQAEMISANSSAALAFGDEVSAERELMALSAVPRIISACILNNDGKIIAKYQRN
ncbi:MAG: CHASE sensor domain-containing protein, partial [bacterium]